MQLWASEYQTHDMRISLRVRESLYHERSEYQDILVVDSYTYGRVLFLDGTIQTTEKDEFFYHEQLTHVPLFVHPGPKRVLIIGGGDGGVLREVLKHPEVAEAVLVDIDAKVTEVSKRFFPTLSTGFSDHRARVIHQDGIRYVKENGDFDVILVDSTDPVGPATGLYTADFYGSCLKALRGDGLLCVQSESPLVMGDVLRGVVTNMRQVAPQLAVYGGPVPTYPGALWCYTLAGRSFSRDMKRPLSFDTRYYTAGIHQGAFELPPYAREIIE